MPRRPVPVRELSPLERRFLETIRDAGGVATRKQVGCVTGKDEEKARRTCADDRLANFGWNNRRQVTAWHLTPRGRKLLANPSGPGPEGAGAQA